MSAHQVEQATQGLHAAPRPLTSLSTQCIPSRPFGRLAIALAVIPVLMMTLTAATAADVPIYKAPVSKATSSAPNDNGAPDWGYFYAGVDVSKYSYSGIMGALIAPYKDMNASGLRILIGGEGGVYKYGTATGFIRGTYVDGQLLIGQAFEGDNYSVNLLAGANAINHTLSRFDPDNSVRDSEFGAKVRGEIWVNPTSATMIYGEAEYSTAFQTYFASAKVGYDIAVGKQLFVGPEVAVLGNERFDQWRVGAHLSQMMLGKRLSVDISAGYANDSSIGGGAYTNIQFSRNF
jgi:hypothetical protein